MLSRHHIELSLFSAAILFDWLMVPEIMFFLVLLFGIFVGSLIPDTDLPKSRMDYMEGVAGFFGLISKVILNPMVARIFGFLLKRPIDQGHRGITHSVYGITAYCLVIAGVGLPIFVAIGWWGIMTALLSLFILGLFVGGILHLGEDACTRSGIVPFYPVDSTRKYSGSISTFDFKDNRPNLFSLGLFIVAFLSVLVQVIGRFQFWAAILLSVVSFVIVWKIILAKSGVTRTTYG
jgi:membrane-bound metal-dependent hydrolase YbcI (DUF457 family)